MPDRAFGAHIFLHYGATCSGDVGFSNQREMLWRYLREKGWFGISSTPAYVAAELSG